MKEKEETKLQRKLAVSAKELAEMLGISVRQVWRLRAAGQLPGPVYLGGSVKWKTSDVELFAECDFDVDVFNARKEADKC